MSKKTAVFHPPKPFSIKSCPSPFVLDDNDNRELQGNLQTSIHTRPDAENTPVSPPLPPSQPPPASPQSLPEPQLYIDLKMEDMDYDKVIPSNNLAFNPTSNSIEQRVSLGNAIEATRKPASNIKDKVFYIRKMCLPKTRKNYTIVQQYAVTTSNIMKAIDEQSKENTDENDKYLDILCRNLYGQFNTVKMSFIDKEVNRTMKSWAEWYNLAPQFRDTPLMYKCYLCYRGWWRLHPLLEHLKVHRNVSFKLRTEPIQHEFNIVASAKLIIEPLNVAIDSNCWKCGRNAEFHQYTTAPTRYCCSGCTGWYLTCTLLKEHENMCSGKINLLYQDYSFDASNVSACTVCNVYCMSKSAMDAHMIDCHTVRSDEPTSLYGKLCALCNGVYYYFKYHDCSAVDKPYECNSCFKAFSKPQLRQMHRDVSSSTSGMNLSHYLDPLHYLQHSKNYSFVYACRRCDSKVLFDLEKVCQTHMRSHCSRGLHVRMLMPVKCLTGEIVTNVETFSIPDKSLIRFMADIEKFSPMETTERTPQTNEIESTLEGAETEPPTASFIAEDNVDDVIVLDDNDDVVPQTKLGPNLDEKVCATKDKTWYSGPSNSCSLKNEELTENSEENKDKESGMKVVDEEPLRSVILEDGSAKEGLVVTSASDLCVMAPSSDLVSDYLGGPTFIDDGVEDVDAMYISELMKTSKNVTKIDRNEGEMVCIINDEAVDVDNNEKCSKPDDITQSLSNSNEDLDGQSFTNVMGETLPNENINKIEPKLAFQDDDGSESSDLLVIDETRQITSDDQSSADVVEMKSEDQLYECRNCDFKENSSRYAVHVSLKCPNRQFKCVSCVDFPSLSKYLEHLTEHGYKRLSCPECMIPMSSSEEIKEHVSCHIINSFSDAMTSEQKILQLCKNCGKFVPPELLFDHWQRHLYGQCDIIDDASQCSDSRLQEVTFMKPELLEETHEILRNADQKIRRNCNICSRTITKFWELKRHLIEHLLVQAMTDRNEGKGNTIECYYCVKKFKMTRAWRVHMRKHCQLKVYKCKQCSKCYDTYKHFYKHKRDHISNVYVCNSCGKEYSTRLSLSLHARVHKKPVARGTCGQSANEQNKPKPKPKSESTPGLFHCTICTRIFHSLNERRQHCRTAHNQRQVNLECKYCKQHFRTAYDVMKHTILVHNDTYNTALANHLG